MIFTHENEWIVVKDYLPYCAFLNLQKGRVVETLPDLITSWSVDAPINEYYCGLLSKRVVDEIINFYINQIKEFKQLDTQKAFKVMKGLLRGHKFGNDPFVKKIMEDYYTNFLVLTDHKGNLINYLYDGGLCNQPFDFVIMYSIFKSAFAEYLAEENRHMNQPRKGVRR